MTERKESEEKKAPATAGAKPPAPPATRSQPPQAPPETPAEDDSPDVPVSDLIARSDQFLGVPSYIAAGALHDKSGDMQIDAAKEAVESWLASEVS